MSMINEPLDTYGSFAEQHLTDSLCLKRIRNNVATHHRKRSDRVAHLDNVPVMLQKYDVPLHDRVVVNRSL